MLKANIRLSLIYVADRYTFVGNRKVIISPAMPLFESEYL